MRWCVGRWESDSVARVAQLVEHTLGKGEVTGSIPVASFGQVQAIERIIFGEH